MMMVTLSIPVVVGWTWLQRKKEDKVSWHERHQWWWCWHALYVELCRSSRVVTCGTTSDYSWWATQNCIDWKNRKARNENNEWLVRKWNGSTWNHSLFNKIIAITLGGVNGKKFGNYAVYILTFLRTEWTMNSEMKNSLLKIAIKVVKMTLAIEKK
jgi:hypothetical protein